MSDHHTGDTPGVTSQAELRRWLLAAVARRINGDPAALDPRERFSRYGVDSIKAAALTAELSDFLRRPLPRTLLWDNPSIDAVVRHLTSTAAPSPAPAQAAAPRATTPRDTAEPVAIVGLACRFPLAPDASAYWRLLTEGVDAIREVPGSRWDLERFYHPDLSVPGRMTTRWGGFVDDVDKFDPQFFGISPREAVQMDPQQRVMLELAWEALEDAGLSAERVKGTPTAVFVGAMWSDYARLMAGSASAITQHTATGQDTSIIPARVSYTFGLQGPSVAVNTACSSSLMAVHLACQALRTGEATLALAGGVNLILSPESTVAMSKFGAMAPDGRSKAFDARADGYVRGEGAGLLVLKPLSQALRDGDPVYCVIAGSATNNDGFSNGLTAPNPQAQEDMLRMAYARAGVPAADVDYIETHGTGTLLGDPIEAGAIGRALGAAHTAERPLLLGSVKTNIGHLEAAAGVAGLIKVALAMRHGRIPGSLHFQSPNPNIDFEALHLAVQRATTPWPVADRPGIAGVSSFGFGGTNCHVVLKQWTRSASELVALSADSPDDLRAAARDLRQRQDIPLEPGAGPVRAAINVRSAADLTSGLDALIDERQAPGVVASGTVAAPRPRLVWVFSPHGGQWAGMGRQLIAEEPVFRAALERCAAAIQQEVGWDLFEELLADEAHSRFSDVAVTQPAIFAIQAALVALWRSWGVRPDAVIGHSMGEVAAAYGAGVLTLEDAVKVICHRSRLLARTAGKGALAVVGLSADATEAALAGRGDGLWIVAFNSPSSTLVSGESEPLGALLTDLEAQGVFCRRVRVDVAAHSPHMDPLLDELFAAVHDVVPSRGTAVVYSTVDGCVLPGEAFDAAYWVRNLRRPVLFAQAVEDVLAGGPAVFLEIGPHPVLAPSLQQYTASGSAPLLVLESLRRAEDERAAMLDALGRIYVSGAADPAWEAVHNRGTDSGTELFVVSAHSREALAARAADLAAWIEAASDLSLHDVCYTAAARRTAQTFRFATPVRSRQDLVERLRAFADGSLLPGAAAGERSTTGTGGLAFVFSGGGAEWQGMGRDLLGEPAFRTAIDRCDAAIQSLAGWSVLDALNGADASAGGPAPEVKRASLFAVQVGLAALWRSWGFEPAAVLGDAAGEVAAAHVAGVLTLADAARIVCGTGHRVAPQAGSLPIYSTLSGARQHGTDFTTEYWPRTLRGSSRLPAAVARLAAEGCDTFVEIGPGALLTPAIQTILQDTGTPGVSMPSLREDQDGRRTLLTAVGAFFCHGRDLAWERLFTDGGRVVSLGPYSWQRDSYWLTLPQPPAPAGTPDLAAETPASHGGSPEDAVERWLYQPLWHRDEAAAPAAEDTRPGKWLVLADRGGCGNRLAEDLRRRGHRCVLAFAAAGGDDALNPSDAEGFKAICRRLAEDDSLPWHGIVHLWSLDAPDLTNASGETPGLVDAQLESCGALTFLVQALVACGIANVPPITVVTKGAQPVAASPAIAAAQAPVWAVARSLAHEHADLRCHMVDLDPDANAMQDLARELARADRQPQVAFRAGGRWTPRLERLLADPAAAGRPVTFDPAAAYVITGGLGALGLHVARWMAERGARRVVLTGRSARGETSHPALAELRARGVIVETVQCDAAVRGDVDRLMQSIQQSGAPLKGIVHAAGVLDDGVLLQQNWPRFERVLAPKVAGTWNLHAATAGVALDFFVLFSSTSALLGASGQSNYAAANAFQDAFASWRRAAGLPALSVNWGTWAGSGMAARMSGADRRRLAESGLQPMDPARAIDALERAFATGAPQVAVVAIDWTQYLARYAAAPAFFSSVTAMSPSGAATRREPSLIVQLAQVPDERRIAAVSDHVRRQVLAVLGAPATLAVRVDQGLRDVGLDSLMALELKDRLQVSVAQPLPATLVFDYPTIAAITDYLAREVLGLARAPVAAAAVTAAGSLPGLSEDMTEEQAEVLLSEELSLLARGREHGTDA